MVLSSWASLGLYTLRSTTCFFNRRRFLVFLKSCNLQILSLRGKVVDYLIPCTSCSLCNTHHPFCIHRSPPKVSTPMRVLYSLVTCLSKGAETRHIGYHLDVLRCKSRLQQARPTRAIAPRQFCISQVVPRSRLRPDSWDLVVISSVVHGTMSMTRRH